jgi:signal transduction histidine kinase
MVTYIDLLKNEGLDSPRAEEYLDVLHQKTDRLCQLTDDLFEAAKASSGAMPVEMMKVDFLSLLNQGLGEMDEKIEASGLDFVINHPEERYYVMADGRLLWRVISNLLSNVFKYSQDGTRVYIDFYDQQTKKGNVVIMEMKNISRQSLNVEPEVLMERFNRGDASRTIEGSGLGLTIAKDLMKLMGGWIDITIDGDLFKVKLMLKSAEQEKKPLIINEL